MLNAEHISDVVFVNLMHSFPAPLWLFRADITFTLISFKWLFGFVLVSFWIISLLVAIVGKQLAGCKTVTKHRWWILTLNDLVFTIFYLVFTWIPYGWRISARSIITGRIIYPIMTRLRLPDNFHYLLNRRHAIQSTAIALINTLQFKGRSDCLVHLVFNSHALIFHCGIH